MAKSISIKLPFALDNDKYYPKINSWGLEVRQGTNPSAVTEVTVNVVAAKTATFKIYGGYITNSSGVGADTSVTLATGVQSFFIKMISYSGILELVDPINIDKLGNPLVKHFFNNPTADGPYHILRLDDLPPTTSLSLSIGNNNIISGNIDKIVEFTKTGSVVRISNPPTMSRSQLSDVYGELKTPLRYGVTNMLYDLPNNNFRGAAYNTSAFASIQPSALLFFDGKIPIKGQWSDFKVTELDITGNVDVSQVTGGFADFYANINRVYIRTETNTISGDLGDMVAPVRVLEIRTDAARPITYTKSKAWGSNMLRFSVANHKFSDADAERLLTDLNAKTWVATGGTLLIRCNNTPTVASMLASIQAKGVTVTRYN